MNKYLVLYKNLTLTSKWRNLLWPEDALANDYKDNYRIALKNDIQFTVRI